MCVLLKWKLEWHKSGVTIPSLHYFLAEFLKFSTGMCWNIWGHTEQPSTNRTGWETENLLIAMSHFCISPVTVLRWWQLSCKRHFVICECALHEGSCLLTGWQNKLCVHVCLIHGLWAYRWFLILNLKKRLLIQEKINKNINFSSKNPDSS